MAASIIVAMTPDRVIGRGGQLPWHLAADLRRFQRLTMGHHLIMGRKTFDSIGRLLPGRETIVVSRQAELVIPGAQVVSSVPAALACACQDAEPFVIGGAQIYRAALDTVQRIYLTLVQTQVDGDAFFPDLVPDEWEITHEEQRSADARNEYAATYRVLVRRRFAQREF